MERGLCEQQATNITSTLFPHQTNTSVSQNRFIRDDIAYTNVSWSNACASTRMVVPSDNGTTNSSVTPTAIVIKITQVTNSDPLHPIAMHLASCDGTTSYNASYQGVYVVKGPFAAVVIERSSANKTDKCPGSSSMTFFSTPLEDYCKMKTDTPLNECPTSAPPPTKEPTKASNATKDGATTKSMGSSLKQSIVLAAFGVLSFVATVI
jgi:hypothetical protein